MKVLPAAAAIMQVPLQDSQAVPKPVKMATHLEYAVNMITSTYPSAFNLHFFLGPIPQKLDLEAPQDVPVWIAQQYIMPISTSGNRQSTSGSAPGYMDVQIPDTTPIGYDPIQPTPTTLQTQTSPASRAPNSPSTESSPLPSTFLANAVRASIPLTRPLLKALDCSDPNGLEESKVRPYLEQQLNWLAISQPWDGTDPKRLAIGLEDGQVPLRLFVIENIRENAAPGKVPKTLKTEIVWSATRGKTGGLCRGELAEVEQQICSTT
ncbi:MAG: hypothetical protein M1814_000150 [Vezdaea aestivalis]|nr:MAG: hypothetical protein M1814_000150 [Vezdaea aestivalis]